MRRGILSGRMNEVCRNACDLHAYSNVLQSLERSSLQAEKRVNDGGGITQQMLLTSVERERCKEMVGVARVNAPLESLSTTKRRKKDN